MLHWPGPVLRQPDFRCYGVTRGLFALQLGADALDMTAPLAGWVVTRARARPCPAGPPRCRNLFAIDKIPLPRDRAGPRMSLGDRGTVGGIAVELASDPVILADDTAG